MSRVDAVRRFNRFYTRRIGVLQPGYLGSPFPLPQARVLYELGQRGDATASELGADLDLDLGYLSRLLQGLRRQGLVQGAADGNPLQRAGRFCRSGFVSADGVHQFLQRTQR